MFDVAKVLFTFGLVACGVGAQASDREPTPATFAVEKSSAFVFEGEPVLFECVVQTKRELTATFSMPQLERWDETLQAWVPLAHTAHADPALVRFESGRKAWLTMLPEEAVRQLVPGRWRASFGMRSETGVPIARQAVEWKVLEHTVNRRIMTGEDGAALESAWRWAVSGQRLGPVFRAPPGALGGGGPLTTREAVGRDLERLARSGASPRLSLRANLVRLDAEIQTLRRSKRDAKLEPDPQELLRELERCVRAGATELGSLGGLRSHAIRLRSEVTRWVGSNPAAKLGDDAPAKAVEPTEPGRHRPSTTPRQI